MTDKENLKRIGEIIDMLTKNLDCSIVEILLNQMWNKKDEEINKYLKAIQDLNYLENENLKSEIESYINYKNENDE